MATILKKLSFQKKLIVLFVLLLCFSSITIGVTAYLVARDSLNDKGEVMLKNGVNQALMLIDAQHQLFEEGCISEDQAQENIKRQLLGPLNDDGTRSLHGNIDLGEYGYLIIYDQDGNEIMHPTLEGENVWSVVDYSDDEHFLVQEQIKAGLKGGGFTYYSWLLPHSNKIGQKISYANYDENWEWIVIATAYEVDFNAESTIILYILIGVIVMVLFISSFVIIIYVSEVLKPVLMVVEGMSSITNGQYKRVQSKVYSGEIEILVNGYNKMLDELEDYKEDLLKHQDRLTYLAYHDELTSLPNRSGFKDYVTSRMESEIINGYMIQFDVVGLKEINSTMGFEKGDEILKVIADYCVIYDQGKNYISRTSSNEFGLWLENIRFEEMKTIVNQLRYEIKNYAINKGINHVIELYAAAASYPEEGLIFDTLYEKATMAMKDAKEHNNLSINSYVIGMKQSIENEISMKNHLYNAIKNSEIIPFYQTKINFETEEVVGVEALARWNSPRLGNVFPNIFIPALERLNLMSDFTKYMMDYVLSDYKKLVIKYNPKISVSINVPPSVFIEKDFPESIRKALRKSKVPGDKIIIEITEDIFIADSKKVSNIVNELHNLGIRVSIDDFGTGYSSLNYLVNIDFDEMKIDRSFIEKIIEDDKVFKLFEILCKIAEVYDYQIVAEGVETLEQLEKIKTTSLKIIQGYLFSKPEKL